DVPAMSPEDDRALAQWLADPDRPKVMHDAKGPMHALHAHGWTLRGLACDTAIAAYLARPDQRTYDLADLSLRYLRRELREEADGGQLTLDVEEGAGADAGMVRARAAVDLAEVLEDEVGRRGGSALLRDVELPLVHVLADMERIGIAVEDEVLAELEEE